MGIIERLQIRVVPRDAVPADWHEITIAVHLHDPLLESMWNTLRDCEAFAVVTGSYLVFWRRKPELTGKQLYRKQFGELTRVNTGCRTGRSRS
jgi:hypothetical protein